MRHKNISDITRRDIADLFCKGYIDTSLTWDNFFNDFSQNNKVFYAYYGRLEEIDFLKKIYELDKIPSRDSRFKNAEGDIYQHTVNNSDWEDGWIFTDSRFGLTDGDDSIFLNFLCTVFHPAYRKEDEPWKKYLDKIQLLLRPDGYELYISESISGRDVYSWRELTKLEKEIKSFLPFSVRNKDKKLPKIKITLFKRKAILEVMTRMEESEYLTTDTGWNYNLPTKEAVVEDLKHYYTPMAYNQSNNYVEDINFDNLVLRTAPKCVFDIIELYFKYKDNSFQNEVNVILKDVGYQLKDGKIMYLGLDVYAETPIEPNLKDMIQIAETYRKKYDEDSMQTALEKIWDVFESLKTYYGTDKKRSMSKIISLISPTDTDLNKQIDEECKLLTNIGNTYKIRHFEKGKLEIPDIRIKEYFYIRCLAMINLILKYVESK